MFEKDGVWFVIGNRTLNNLNLAGCNISENGLKLLAEVIHEQELSENTQPEGIIGLFRMLLLVSTCNSE